MERELAVRELRRLVRSFLRNEMDFATFEREYVEFFADGNADEFFDERDHELYGALFERLQWTSERPSGIDRASGYHTIADTSSWIREQFTDVA